jgi:hypothetical protein
MHVSASSAERPLLCTSAFSAGAESKAASPTRGSLRDAEQKPQNVCPGNSSSIKRSRGPIQHQKLSSCELMADSFFNLQKVQSAHDISTEIHFSLAALDMQPLSSLNVPREIGNAGVLSFESLTQ